MVDESDLDLGRGLGVLYPCVDLVKAECCGASSRAEEESAVGHLPASAVQGTYKNFACLCLPKESGSQREATRFGALVQSGKERQVLRSSNKEFLASNSASRSGIFSAVPQEHSKFTERIAITTISNIAQWKSAKEERRLIDLM